jgi:plastocyanin
MKNLALLTLVGMLMFVAGTPAVQATEWHGIVGAQSEDMGRQGLAFLPNEFWVHVGDSITWTFSTTEIHTVSFLSNGQIRPTFQAGCPGSTPDGSSYTGTACVNSGTFASGQTYTVNFPTAGNFKLVCLVHANMTAMVHVLNLTETLPHDQAFYDDQANNQQAKLLSDGSRLEGRGTATAEHTSKNEVSAGIGEIVATGAGHDTVSVMRFMRKTIVVHVGDTVEWTNLDPVTNHTVTFGTEPADFMPPSVGVTGDSDGARHAVVGSPTDSVNSGLLGAARQDRVGLAQTPSGVTRFRTTFTSPGTFNYFCALHDNLDMVGTVIVLPAEDHHHH